MRQAPRDPARWRARDADRHAIEDRAAALASAAAEVAPLDAKALARIRTEVLAGRAPTSPRGLALFPVRLRWALLAALLLLVSATTAGGASVLWRRFLAPRLRPDAASSPAPRAEASRRLPPRGRQERPSPSSEGVPPPAPDEAPPPASTAARLPAAPPHLDSTVGQRARPPSLAAPPPPRAVEPQPSRAIPAAVLARVAEPPRETESRLLARALFQLRQGRDPRRALATLDQYGRVFPAGVLSAEAASARLEALIALADWKAALRLLDGVATFSEPMGADLWLTRAELRADAGRCREALADFTGVLDGQGGALAGAVGERALYGRAVCLGRLREDARARADLQEYRRRFPGGRFASDVDRLLGGRAPSEAP